MSDYEEDSNYSGSESDDDSISENKKIIKPKIGDISKKVSLTIDDEDDDDPEDDPNELEDEEEDPANVALDEESEPEEFDPSDEEPEEEEEIVENIEQGSSKKNKNIKVKKPIQIELNSDDDDEDEDDELYLQKFDSEITKNYINDFHPECLIHNYDEIAKLTNVVRNSSNIIIDPLHKTIPFLTKYEKARILGQRAKQIETGARPFINIPENVIDSYIIAELELQQKRIPFIIRRPIPGGACEYWNVKDLENISF
jgi:DNA-directed RNA polymerase subunit K/omega